MSRVARYIVLLLLVMSVAWGKLYAQSEYAAYGSAFQNGTPRRTMEMGVTLNGSYMLCSADEVVLNPKFGVRGALVMSLCWDEIYALQMEIAYAHNKIDASLPGAETLTHSVKNNIFEVPILFSFRGLGPVRINLGPVLSLAGTASYDLPDERIEFGRLRSTLGAAFGVGVKLSQHFMLEARYTSSFTPSSNYFEGREFSTRSHWLTFGLGYMF